MTVVIGYGNPLRGDDGVGPIVAERVGRLQPHVQVLTPHQLLPELADAVSRASLVVFIDAAADGAPGDISCDPVKADADSRLDHVLSPSALLQLARTAYGYEPLAWLVRVNGHAFDFGPALSAPVAGAIPGAVEVVRHLIPTD